MNPTASRTRSSSCSSAAGRPPRTSLAPTRSDARGSCVTRRVRASSAAATRSRASRPNASSHAHNSPRSTGSGWWEHASAREIVDAWDTARQWREHDPIAENAAARMRAEMLDRFAIDPVARHKRARRRPGRTLHQPRRDREARGRPRASSSTVGVGRQVKEALLELSETRRAGDGRGPGLGR